MMIHYRCWRDGGTWVDISSTGARNAAERFVSEHMAPFANAEIEVHVQDMRDRSVGIWVVAATMGVVYEVRPKPAALGKTDASAKQELIDAIDNARARYELHYPIGSASRSRDARCGVITLPSSVWQAILDARKALEQER